LNIGCNQKLAGSFPVGTASGINSSYYLTWSHTVRADVRNKSYRQLKALQNWFLLHDSVLDFFMETLSSSTSKDIDELLTEILTALRGTMAPRVGTPTVAETSTLHVSTSYGIARDVVHLRILRWILCFLIYKQDITELHSSLIVQILQSIFVQPDFYFSNFATLEENVNMRDDLKKVGTVTSLQNESQRGVSNIDQGRDGGDRLLTKRPFLFLIHSTLFELLVYIINSHHLSWFNFLASGIVLRFRSLLLLVMFLNLKCTIL